MTVPIATSGSELAHPREKEILEHLCDVKPEQLVGAVIPCPKRGTEALTNVATNCGVCPYFQGVLKLSEDERLPYNARHRIVCNMPVARSFDMVRPD